MFEERRIRANFVASKGKEGISYMSLPMVFARFCFQNKQTLCLWVCDELKKSLTRENVISIANFFFNKLYV